MRVRDREGQWRRNQPLLIQGEYVSDEVAVHRRPLRRTSSQRISNLRGPFRRRQLCQNFVAHMASNGQAHSRFSPYLSTLSPRLQIVKSMECRICFGPDGVWICNSNRGEEIAPEPVVFDDASSVLMSVSSPFPLLSPNK